MINDWLISGNVLCSDLLSYAVKRAGPMDYGTASIASSMTNTVSYLNLLFFAVKSARPMDNGTASIASNMSNTVTYLNLLFFAVKSVGPMDDGTASIASSVTSGYAGSIASSVNSNASAKTPKSVPPDHVITLLEGKWTRKYCVYHECEDWNPDIKLISIFNVFISSLPFRNDHDLSLRTSR